MNIELMREITYKKSWGRNQILKLEGFDKSILHKVSSDMETPNVNRGTVLKILSNLNNDKDYLTINEIDKVFQNSCDNMTKDFVITICIQSGLNQKILNIFENKLRAKNSKRHLRDKIYMSYFEYLQT